MTRAPKLLLLGALCAVLLAVFATAAAADGCAGESGCPYDDMAIIGSLGDGTLRFPQAVALGPEGNVYVGDQYSHVIQVFTPQGRFVRQFGGAGTKPGQLGAVGGLAVDQNGTVYIVGSGSRVDRFSSEGSYIGSFGHLGSAAGEFNFGSGSGNDSGAGGGIAVAGGQVYVADTRNDRIQRMDAEGNGPVVIVRQGVVSRPQGLTIRNYRLLVADDTHHRVVAFDLGGRFLKAFGSQGSGPGQFKNPYDVGLDAAGHVFVADDSNHRVLKFGVLPNYGYLARWGSYGDGLGQLQYPRSIAVDAPGNQYVANTGANRIEVFDVNGTPVRNFGSSARAAGHFIAPLGVAADASGVVAVADSVDGRIELFGPDRTPLAVWGSPSPGPTILPNPAALAFDTAGTAYVLDQNRGRILVFDRAGNVKRTIASSGNGPGQLSAPSAIAIDGSGRLYVADTGNGRIARFTTGGDYLGAIGDFSGVRGIAVTPDGGTIYAADGSTSRIYVLDAAGAEVASFGGKGKKAGQFDAPAQIGLAPDGTLWVADKGNSRVQAFAPDHSVIATFGSRGTGPGQFIHPTGVVVDCHGMLTVSDSDNNRVQQFRLSPAPAGLGCSSLPAVSGPLVAKLPTLPPPVQPQLEVKVLRLSQLFSQRSIPVSVRCDVRCTATLTAKLRPRKKPKKHHKATIVSLGRGRAKLTPGKVRVIRATLSRGDVRRLRKALKGAHGLTVDLQVTARASDSAPSTYTKHGRASG